MRPTLTLWLCWNLGRTLTAEHELFLNITSALTVDESPTQRSVQDRR